MSYQPTRYDWPEDFSLENGNYQNVCIHCNTIFVGHKRRVVCKRCSQAPAAPSTHRPYPDEHHA